MKTAQPPLSTFHPGRHLQVLDEKAHDPNQIQEELAEPAVCDICGAAYQHGSWRWTTPSVDAVQARCPACRRTLDKHPAGCITIEGEFARDHQDEIMHLVLSLEGREKADHPLHRIMSHRVEEDKLLVETTDVHFARSIGESLVNAYQGDLEARYSDAEQMLRLHWKQ